MAAIFGDAPEEFSVRLFVRRKLSQPAIDSMNTVVTIQPPKKGRDFGQAFTFDWELAEGREADAKVVGRTQGQVVYTDSSGDNVNKNNWYMSYSFIFENEGYKGSSLQVRGPWISPFKTTSYELAIVGGTGRFTLAQGVVYAKVEPRTDPNGDLITEHLIRAFYRPLEKPDAF